MPRPELSPSIRSEYPKIKVSNPFTHLNSEQMKAIEFNHDEGPVLLLAGAGSGKTSVLTHRIAYLVMQGYAAHSILALTFTRDAAQEMKSRVRKILQESGKNDKGIKIATFHSFAYRLLSQSREGIPNWERLGLDSSPLEPRSESSEAEKRPDFDKMVPLCLQLLKTFPALTDELSREISHVLVDEFQDTSPDQLELLVQLRKKDSRLMLVGDDDQAIYGFRGADVGNLHMSLNRFSGMQVLKLETNYRSTSSILDYANGIFRSKPGKFRKILKPGRSDTSSVFKAGLPVDYKSHETAAGEIRWICKKIEFLRNKFDLDYSDFALLFRINAQKTFYRSSIAQLIGDDGAGQIVYSTVHGAKGLQYPVVFLAGLEDGTFPYIKSGEKLTTSREQEEKRLFYVGVTRAESALFLSCCQSRILGAKLRRFKPSRFLISNPVSGYAFNKLISKWKKEVMLFFPKGKNEREMP